ncbi:MAG: endonuclease [Xenococcus sp. (in: cyanobacteria)]
MSEILTPNLGGLIMIFAPAALALVSILMLGYVACVSIGTWAYFTNDKKK